MKKKLHAGFTLVEMMIVLLIISVLVLLFIPNLAQEKDT
ncbi:MAG: prepilin-type N-terminal cleavage/methylation domain-containing protein, partial [Enterococcus aquimarinus]